jgi:hypothetical protein
MFIKKEAAYDAILPNDTPYTSVGYAETSSWCSVDSPHHFHKKQLHH